MSEYEYQEERYQDVIEEMKPLLEEHYQEVAMYQEVVNFNPNYELYETMADQGIVDFFTCRKDGELIGYCVTFLQMNPHYQDHIYAVNDVIYVAPEHRHTEVAPEMITRLEDRMIEKGVSVMSFHMKIFKPFESLMDALAFDKAEYVFMKLIKE
jgi:GNAT superfamily N-acetyltransferase